MQIMRVFTKLSGKFSYEDLCSSCLKVIKSLNSVGVDFDINGIENIKQIEPPFVIIANRMSISC